ncbi:MAG: ribonuclease E/G, partial [Planctomycetota bacterium]
MRRTRKAATDDAQAVAEAPAEASAGRGRRRRRPTAKKKAKTARRSRSAGAGEKERPAEEAEAGKEGKAPARKARRRKTTARPKRKTRKRKATASRAPDAAPPEEVADETVEEVTEAAAEPPPPPVEKVLLVNAADAEETRIALLEDGVLEEIYIEGTQERSAIGNIYRGRVQNVEKGIGAAFVDLGRGFTGFLHVSDLPERPSGQTVTDLLEPGQEVVVQITRDSIGRKGPALSGRIALPGRYLVLLANTPRSGVSRRIGRGRTRDRARKLLSRIEIPEGMGVIVRTAGEEGRLADLEQDLRLLLAEWKHIEEQAAQSGPPTLLRGESTIAERSVRDIMPPDTARIVVDDPEVATEIRELLAAWYESGEPAPAEAEAVAADAEPAPAEAEPEAADAEPATAEEEESAGAAEEAAAPATDGDGDGDGEASDAPKPASPASRVPEVLLHDDPMPLFHAYEVEQQLETAFRRALRLESGGSIVIDPTEALIAVDVNSGRSTGEEDPEATALGTNLEAAKEAARQLRLRDLGGLVVVDFIDMRDRRAVRQVEKAFREALSRDRARIRVGRIGPFGCLVLSRQRIRQALSRVTHEECGSCGGTGRRRHAVGLGLRVLREMEARAARSRGRGGLEVRLPQPVLD